MSQIYIFLGIAYLFLTICVLVAFFKMCGNVKKIREHLNPELPECYVNAFYPKFNFYMSVGDKEKAKELLYQQIMTSPNFAATFKNNFSEDARAKLIEEYQPYFQQLGMEIDFSKIKLVE